MVISLWDRARLAEDSGMEDTGGRGGITLAHNVRTTDEVDAVLDDADRAAAQVVRAGAPTFWGGYSGVFIDPALADDLGEGDVIVTDVESTSYGSGRR